MIHLITTSLIALGAALGILLYLDASTLFLAALLLAVVAIKTQNRGNFLDKTSGLWFALSVAPAFSISIEKITDFQNGFLVQVLLSFMLFLYFFITKPSVIKRLHESKKVGVGLVLSSSIAGFAAGISSAALWQIYLQFTT